MTRWLAALCFLLVAALPAIAQPIGLSIRAVDDAGKGGASTVIYGTTERVRLSKQEIVDHRDLESAEAAEGNGQWGLRLHLTRAGAEKLQRFTEKNMGRRIGILLDGILVSAPVIRTAVSSDVMVTGGYTEKQVRRLAAQLDAGRTPRRELIYVLYWGSDPRQVALAEVLYQRIHLLKWQAGYLPSRIQAEKGEVEHGYRRFVATLHLGRGDLPAILVLRIVDDTCTWVDMQRRVSDGTAASRAVERAGADLEAVQTP